MVGKNTDALGVYRLRSDARRAPAPREAGSAERGAAGAGAGAGGGPCGTARRRLQDPDLWHWREGICDGLDYNSLRVDTVFIYM